MSQHLSSRVGPGHGFGDQTRPTGAKPLSNSDAELGFYGNQPWAIQEPDSLLLCLRQCAPQYPRSLALSCCHGKNRKQSVALFFKSSSTPPHVGITPSPQHVRSCAFSFRVYLLHTLIHGDPTTLGVPSAQTCLESQCSRFLSALDVWKFHAWVPPHNIVRRSENLQCPHAQGP